MIPVIAAASLRGPQPLPVGCPIAGPRKTIPLHKRFHQLHGMTVLFHPIPSQSRRGKVSPQPCRPAPTPGAAVASRTAPPPAPAVAAQTVGDSAHAAHWWQDGAGAAA